MKILTALVQDLTVATKGAFGIKLVKSHSKNHVITFSSKSVINKMELAKLLKVKMEKVGLNIPFKMTSYAGLKNHSVSFEMTVGDKAELEVNRIPLSNKPKTLGSSLKDYLTKYGFIPTDWKNNSTKGLVEIYGLPANKGDMLVSMINDYYRQYGLTKVITVNPSKESGLVNIRIKN